LIYVYLKNLSDVMIIYMLYQFNTDEKRRNQTDDDTQRRADGGVK